MTKPLFSIATVTLNASQTLERTLDSVRAQEFKDFEYVLVDGGSTDGTLDIIEANRDLITNFVSEKDCGISDAFNKAIALTCGTFVGIVNADDWYMPETLSTVASVAQRHHADVYCGLQQYWENGKPSYLFDANFELLNKFMSVNHIASFARRELFTKFGYFKLDYRIAMDYELYLRFYRKGAKFHRVDAAIANVSLGGVSDRSWKQGLLEVLRAQIENGVSPHAAYWNYLFMLSKGSLRRGLGAAGCQKFIDMYRRRIAKVPKTL